MIMIALGDQPVSAVCGSVLTMDRWTLHQLHNGFISRQLVQFYSQQQRDH